MSSLLQHLLHFHSEQVCLKRKVFAFAPEALPGNRSMLEQPGQDRAGSRLSSASETAIECRQLVGGGGGGGCPGARRPRKDKYLVQCTPYSHRRYAGKSRILSGLARVQEFRDGLHRYNSLEPSGTPSLLPIMSHGRATEGCAGSHLQRWITMCFVLMQQELC